MRKLKRGLVVLLVFNLVLTAFHLYFYFLGNIKINNPPYYRYLGEGISEDEIFAPSVESDSDNSFSANFNKQQYFDESFIRSYLNTEAFDYFSLSDETEILSPDKFLQNKAFLSHHKDKPSYNYIWKKFPKPKYRLQSPFFKKKRKVYLDAGHGGSDPGAISPLDDNKNPLLPEKNICLSLALDLRNILRSKGYKVYMTREDDSFISVYARAAMITRDNLQEILENLTEEAKYRQERHQPVESEYFNSLAMIIKKEVIPQYEFFLQEVVEANKDNFGGIFRGQGISYQLALLLYLQKEFSNSVLLSIHANSTLNPKTSGTQAYIVRNGFIYEGNNENLDSAAQIFRPYYEKQDVVKLAPVYPDFLEYNDDLRSYLAYFLYEEVLKKLPELRSPDNTSILERYFVLLRCSGLNSVLYETAYMSNEENFALLTDENKKLRLIKALADAVDRYFSHWQNVQENSDR